MLTFYVVLYRTIYHYDVEIISVSELFHASQNTHFWVYHLMNWVIKKINQSTVNIHRCEYIVLSGFARINISHPEKNLKAYERQTQCRGSKVSSGLLIHDIADILKLDLTLRNINTPSTSTHSQHIV